MGVFRIVLESIFLIYPPSKKALEQAIGENTARISIGLGASIRSVITEEFHS